MLVHAIMYMCLCMLIEKHCVFEHLSLKWLKSIVFLNIWAWNHWKTLCFWTFEFEIIETHCVFNILIWNHWKTLCCLNLWAWNHWKTLFFFFQQLSLKSLKTLCLFSTFELGIIEKHCVFKHLSLELLKRIVFLNSWA